MVGPGPRAPEATSHEDPRCTSPKVGHVAENTNKPDKKLIEEWGLETDEDAGFDLSKYPPLPASALHKASASTRPKPGLGGFGRR